MFGRVILAVASAGVGAALAVVVLPSVRDSGAAPAPERATIERVAGLLAGASEPEIAWLVMMRPGTVSDWVALGRAPDDWRRVLPGAPAEVAVAAPREPVGPPPRAQPLDMERRVPLIPQD